MILAKGTEWLVLAVVVLCVFKLIVAHYRIKEIGNKPKKDALYAIKLPFITIVAIVQYAVTNLFNPNKVKTSHLLLNFNGMMDFLAEVRRVGIENGYTITSKTYLRGVTQLFK